MSDSLSERGLRALLASALGLVRDACLFADDRGVILWASEPAARMCGYTPEELDLMSLSSLSAQGDPGITGPADVPVGGTARTILVQRKNGSVFRARAHACTVDLEERTVTLITLHEMSDRNRARLEADFKSELLDAAFDGILVHTLDGHLLYFNEATHTMVGLTHEEYAALGPWGWVAPEARARRPRLLEALKVSGHVRFETTSVHKDGHAVPTEVHARLVDSPDGPVIVSVVRDVSERRQAEAQVRHMAFHDQLTGLANRSLLDEQLSVAMANTLRHGDLVGIAYVDLDDFKVVNDEHGHAFGDQVLTVAADRLRMCVRRSDTVARLGGDEFVVLLPRIRRQADLERAARKIVNAMREPFHVDGRVVNLSTSVGLALYNPLLDDARSLLIRADLAMYEAKRAATTGYALSDPVAEPHRLSSFPPPPDAERVSTR